jgi:hypothetical protein
MATKYGMTTNFFSPLSFIAVLDPGPRCGIRDPGWVKIRNRDKHPGSATLQKGFLSTTIYCVKPVGIGTTFLVKSVVD